MNIKQILDNALDFVIVFGCSAFAFAIMPIFVLSAWILDQDILFPDSDS